jgi:hypothetical protein
MENKKEKNVGHFENGMLAKTDIPFFLNAPQITKEKYIK